MAAFFSQLAKTFNTGGDMFNYANVNSSGNSFINDSQVDSVVKTQLLTKMSRFSSMDVEKNSPHTNGIYLNTNENKGYVIPIDYLEFGDLLTKNASNNGVGGASKFMDVLNTYKKDAKDVYVTHQYFLDSKKELKQVYSTTGGIQSIFNPYYAVKSNGMSTNQPLVDNINLLKTPTLTGVDTSDCSIWGLLKASTKSAGSHFMGSSIYRLADFMYCKDLGKVSNNHLITLRRYSSPIGDNIFHVSNTGDGENLFSAPPDIGHLVTWFGTDDNKLSDILKMSFHATWKEMNAEIQQVQSQADSGDTGVLGMIANTLNPSYNKSMNSGIAGNHNLISQWLGSKLQMGGVDFSKGGQYEGNIALTNYDPHKIYTPKNTIQSNHYYEGKIEFSHEFTLTFSYKLRAYGDINQKSAMQDLLNNILATTFTKGSFWGGSVKMIGAPGNNSMIKKMNAFIDNTFDKLAGFAENVLTGAINWQELLGSLSDAASGMLNAAGDKAKEMLEDPSGTAKKYGESFINFWKNHDLSSAVKGMLKNGLGRPAMYAINSFVSGENLGLWHVTIGNPLNPIAVMGNLILTNAELSFNDAPLGIDDFPTEMRVAVTLKHCKPRDMTDISRMFTKGESAMALPIAQGGWTKYFLNDVQNEYDKSTYEEKSYQQIFGTSFMGAIGANHAELSVG